MALATCPATRMTASGEYFVIQFTKSPRSDLPCMINPLRITILLGLEIKGWLSEKMRAFLGSFERRHKAAPSKTGPYSCVAQKGTLFSVVYFRGTESPLKKGLPRGLRRQPVLSRGNSRSFGRGFKPEQKTGLGNPKENQRKT